MATVDFYYSIGSRYSYLASTQITALERDTGCRVQWHPLDSTALIARRGRSPFTGPPISGQYKWPYRELDAKRWAALYGAPFDEPRGRVEFDPQTLALAATAAKRLGQVAPYSRQLFAAVFVDPVTCVDLSECARRAEACGIAVERFRAAMESSAAQEELEATVERALGAGVFGVPTFLVEGELFWGNDRLVLLRHRLRPGSSK
ncbi:MAG: 2-hydroxychromene-2-carboxylate isomerase [Candidatus Binatia bacterium]